jgi:hypothetical protein
VIQRWDTLRDEILRQDAGRVHHSNYFGYGLQLTPPAFWSDIAARVIRQAAQNEIRVRLSEYDDGLSSRNLSPQGEAEWTRPSRTT